MNEETAEGPDTVFVPDASGTHHARPPVIWPVTAADVAGDLMMVSPGDAPVGLVR
jgi:hypothetical protein